MKNPHRFNQITNMKNHGKFFALPAFAAVLLAASGCCFNRAPATLYTLDADVPADFGPLPSGTFSEIAFARVSVPDYADVPQIVTRTGENTVARAETRLWAEPLARAVRRAVPVQVSKLLRGKKTRVVKSVSVYVDRLDGALDGEVRIDAQIVIRAKGADEKSASLAYDFSKSVPLPAATSADARYANYVKGVSAAVFALSEAVAGHLEEK